MNCIYISRLFRLRMNHLSALSASAEIVFNAFDIILSEIVAALNLDKSCIYLAGVFNTVDFAAVDVDRFPGFENNFTITHCYCCHALNYMPVFGASLVSLKAQAFSGIYYDSFDFMVRLI